MTEENKTGQYLWSVTEVKTEKKTPFLLSVALWTWDDSTRPFGDRLKKGGLPTCPSGDCLRPFSHFTLLLCFDFSSHPTEWTTNSVAPAPDALDDEGDCFVDISQ